MVSFVQSRSPRGEATLDMDATLVETHKQQALYSYRKYRAYQPLTVYWAAFGVHGTYRRAISSCECLRGAGVVLWGGGRGQR